jgi:hypothetical protein
MAKLMDGPERVIHVPNDLAAIEAAISRRVAQ